MKRLGIILTLVIVFSALFFSGISPAIAGGGGMDILDLCAMRWHDYVPDWALVIVAPPITISPGPDGWDIITGPISNGDYGVADAPVFHDDGRLNYRVCRAPLAVFMNEDGGVEVWSTNEDGLFAPRDLMASATAEEIAAALALAEETGEDVIIDGYVDGFALIAKADGTLKAELIGVYGFDFMPDGTPLNGWGNGFEPFDPGPPMPDPNP